MRRGGYESSGRSVEDLKPPPTGPAVGMKPDGSACPRCGARCDSKVCECAPMCFAPKARTEGER